MGACRLYLTILDQEPLERGRLKKAGEVIQANVKPEGETGTRAGVLSCEVEGFSTRGCFSISGAG